MENENYSGDVVSFGDIPMDYLMHYGIKGQKWGIRRYQNKDGSLTKAGRKRYAKLEAEMEKLGGKKNDDAEDENEAKKSVSDHKKISDMSNEEIQATIDRINLENKLKELMKEPAANVKNDKKTGKGKEIATEILSNTAKNIGGQTATLIAGTFVNKTLKSLFNDPEMTVNPKKGQKDK